MERAYIVEDWPGPWAKWARNYLNRNLWRISRVIGNDIEDAMSEAALVYVETRHRYGATVNSPQHFMRLFQMALSCWITDLSNKDSRIKQALSSIKDEEPSVVPEADLAVLLNEGSSDLKEILSIFFNAPKEIMDVLRADASSYSPKQFWNRVLVHLNINQEKSQKLIKELNDLLS